MTTNQLQDVLDRVAVTSAQRWALAVGAVTAALTASVITEIVAGGTTPLIPIVVTMTAIAAVVRPDSHIALATAALVLAQWTFGVDDRTTAAAVPVALALYAVHAIVALLAVTPPTVTVDIAVFARWGRRSLAVAAATCWTWLTVVALAERDAPGNVALTATALVTLAALLVAARSGAKT